MLNNLIWPFISIAILICPLLAIAQNFTAQAFCENPHQFICETESPIPVQDSSRQRMLEIVQNLRQKYPSVDMFIKNHLSNPITDEELQNFGNLFELAIYRAEATAWNAHAGVDQFDRFRHDFIISKTFNEENGQIIAGLGTRPSEVIAQLPDSHLRQYMSTLLTHTQLGMSGVYDSVIKNSDPFLAQVSTDFFEGGYSPIQGYRFNLENAISAEVDRMASGAFADMESQFNQRKVRVEEYLRSHAPEELRETMLARLAAQSFHLTSSNDRHRSLRCYQGHSFGGTNGSQLGDRVEYCPGHALGHQNSHFHSFGLFAHEIAHAFDSQDLPDAYTNVINCMDQSYADQLLNTQGQPISSMNGESRTRAMTRVSREWIADSFAASFLASEMQRQNLSQTEALSLIHREYRGRFCRGGDWNEGHHGAQNGHPPDRLRIETLLAGNSEIQAFFGCNRFANSRPQNNCQHFNQNSTLEAEEVSTEVVDPGVEESAPVSPTLER